MPRKQLGSVLLSFIFRYGADLGSFRPGKASPPATKVLQLSVVVFPLQFGATLTFLEGHGLPNYPQ